MKVNVWYIRGQVGIRVAGLEAAWIPATEAEAIAFVRLLAARGHEVEYAGTMNAN